MRSNIAAAQKTLNQAARGLIPTTHEGGPAVTFTPQDALKRAVLTCLLFERNYYESGRTIADRIKDLVPKCAPEFVMTLAMQARTDYKLRHVPLLLARELLRHPAKPKGVDDLIAYICQRADEPAELLALYWNDGKHPMAAQLKRGLAQAVTKFDAYQIGKWKGDDKAVKFRDVLFLSHAKPVDEAQGEVWRALIDGKLASPDTWEVALSSGADKRETWERLLQDRKLGYLALLRNLRNMLDVGVSTPLIKSALLARAHGSRALPFRFLSAAKAAPALESVLDEAMQLSLASMAALPGKTRLLIDVSSSMTYKLSMKSDLNRIDAAAALAILLRDVCADVEVWTFANTAIQLPARRGMALRDVIMSRVGGGTMLGAAIQHVAAHGAVDRTIVLTDEQASDIVGPPSGRGYMLDVAGHQNGVGYGAWTRISGFSEACVEFIRATENFALDETPASDE